MVKEFLDRRAVPVTILDATEAANTAFLVQLGRLAAPVVIVGETVVSGYDPAALTEALRGGGFAVDSAGEAAAPTAIATVALPRPRSTPTVWVAGFLDNALGSLDAATGMELPAATSTGPARIPVGQKPMGLAHDPATGWIWVSNYEASTVTRIDAHTGEYVGGSLEAATTPTAAGAADLLLDARRRRVLVSCSSCDELTVLDADTGRHVGGTLSGSTITVGNQPTAMALDDDLDRLFLRAGAGIVTLDAETLQPLGGSLEAAGSLPTRGRTVALDRRRKRLYTPVDDQHVVVLDTAGPVGATREASAMVETARVPFMMVIDEPRDRVIVSCLGDRVVQAIDMASNTVVASGPIGRGARGLALSPDGGALFVSCFEDDAVTVLDAATLTTLMGPSGAPRGPRGCLYVP
ncbi:MAG: hypothetical protein JF603_05440 [Acidobacteria bacterium]|nr:hypothetical protein [Acidobacteriota bacterium]